MPCGINDCGGSPRGGAIFYIYLFFGCTVRAQQIQKEEASALYFWDLWQYRVGHASLDLCSGRSVINSYKSSALAVVMFPVTPSADKS